MSEAEIEALAAKVKALTPAARLRLAADLMEGRRPDVAVTIAKPVIDELQLVLLLRKAGRL